ncbi:MAG: ATP-dependent DNA helicase RecG [Candidatus Dormibacteraeota bacterium]|nr:ATP-dependent DNA helicase RecG [Candidatus Dormibacteraeota bacterium]
MSDPSAVPTNQSGGGAVTVRRRQPAPAVPLTLRSPVSDLPNCAASSVKALDRLGIRTVSDLLRNLPFGWESFSEVAGVGSLEPNVPATLTCVVERVVAKRTPRRGIRLSEATVRDDAGVPLKVIWFNMPFLARQLAPGDRLVLAGTPKSGRYGELELLNPLHEVIRDGSRPPRLGALQPKYHLTQGLKPQRLVEWVNAALPLADGLADVIPAATRQAQRLLPIAEAVRKGHQPDSEAEWREARRRFAFAELLELQAAFLLARRRLEAESASPVPYRQEVIEAFKRGLDFRLTNAQRRSIWEIYQDLEKQEAMNRLLDGDVGSGKTAVAAAAAAMAHHAGLQSLVMAPTEILARQHLNRFRHYLEASFPDLRVELLVSGLAAAERRRVRLAAASGHCGLLVGTHALIEEEVELAALGLVVVDEQHRFGTRQRELLRAKSRVGRPHFLCMSATPIPRSLALALYGEMALSTLDELPPGRPAIITRVIPPDDREVAYQLIRREVGAGRQVFIICPLIEESEALEAKAATVEFERLRRQVFPDLRLGLVHGRLKEKDEVMRAFQAGDIDVLVATAVVEVGVDVANATVMAIEGAERFGLAQLHQFRGRVGRGAQQSHCLLLSDQVTGRALERLQLVAQIQDGFRLAAEDMRLRGAGELMGSRQHGMSDLAMEALHRPELLSEIRQEAESLLAADPGLNQEPALREAALRRLESTAIS